MAKTSQPFTESVSPLPSFLPLFISDFGKYVRTRLFFLSIRVFDQNRDDETMHVRREVAVDLYTCIYDPQRFGKMASTSGRVIH